MTHTKGKVVLDHSIRTAINMAAPPYQHIAMVNITQNKNYTITKEEHDDNARRIAALWNMAERLGLTTEEIESGNVETTLKAAPDMLAALEEVMAELDVEGLPCPLCGGSAASGHRHNCIWHVVASAVKKARGEE